MLHDYAVDVLKVNGADVTPIDLHSLDLPLYNPNEEGGRFPASAQLLKDQLSESGTGKMNLPGFF